MKYLITGAGGFVGQNLSRHLLGRNCKIATCGRSNIEWSPEHYFVDLADINHVREMFLDCKPDVIFHLAGIANGRPNYQNTSDVWLHNVCSTQNLAMSCPIGTKIILASSILVYGQTDGIPEETSATRPQTAYAISKLAAEQVLRSYISSGTIRGGIIRFGPIVGQNMTHGVVKEIIDKLLSHNAEIELIGPRPGNLRSYLWIQDAVESLVSAAERFEGGSIMNICNNDWVSIEQITNILAKKLDVQKDIIWTNNNWYGNPPILSANIDRANRRLNWRPRYSSIDSVELSIHNLIPNKAVN